MWDSQMSWGIEIFENLQKNNYEDWVESVDPFAERAMSLPPQKAQKPFQQVLLLCLNANDSCEHYSDNLRLEVQIVF